MTWTIYFIDSRAQPAREGNRTFDDEPSFRSALASMKADVWVTITRIVGPDGREQSP